MSNLADPFVRALAALESARVDFVIVGVGGINFFAKDPSEALATRDLDVLVRPTPEVLGTALQALDRAVLSLGKRRRAIRQFGGRNTSSRTSGR